MSRLQKKENSRVKLNHSIYENNQTEQTRQFNQNMTLTFVGIDTYASYKYVYA